LIPSSSPRSVNSTDPPYYVQNTTSRSRSSTVSAPRLADLENARLTLRLPQSFTPYGRCRPTSFSNSSLQGGGSLCRSSHLDPSVSRPVSCTALADSLPFASSSVRIFPLNDSLLHPLRSLLILRTTQVSLRVAFFPQWHSCYLVSTSAMSTLLPFSPLSSSFCRSSSISQVETDRFSLADLSSVSVSSFPPLLSPAVSVVFSPRASSQSVLSKVSALPGGTSVC
jgi:hypothetical protein